MGKKRGIYSPGSLMTHAKKRMLWTESQIDQNARFFPNSKHRDRRKFKAEAAKRARLIQIRERHARLVRL